MLDPCLHGGQRGIRNREQAMYQWLPACDDRGGPIRRAVVQRGYGEPLASKLRQGGRGSDNPLLQERSMALLSSMSPIWRSSTFP